MAGLLACGEDADPPSTDAGGSMSDGPSPMPDAQLEAPGGPPSSCTSGLCTSDACQDAERTDIARGCRFYAAQLDNADSDDGKQMMLVMTNADQQSSATFRVELHSPDGEWILVAPQDVVPVGGTARVELSRPLLYSGVAKGGAYRVTSDSPILVTQIISDDADHDSTSSSGTVLLPAHALDRHYMALTFPQLAGDTVLATPGSRGGAGVIAIVATGDGTSVHLMPKVPALVNDTGILTSGFDAVLAEGDVLQVFSYLPGGDLSGTTIDADQPVAVFSGNVFTTYGHVATGWSGGDMALEQLPPLSAWSKEYVGARLAPEDGCTPFLATGGAMWQVVAAQDNTRVTITPSAGTDVLTNNKSFPMVAEFSLNRGQSSVFTTAPDPGWTDAVGPPGDIVVVGSGPILLAQWLDCDAGLSLGIDTRLGAKTNLTLAFPPGFEQQVIITRRAGMPVTFDGYPIPETYFQQIASYEYQVARLTQAQFGSCKTAADSGCQHTINSPLTGVGVAWRGVDIVCSYALTVPPGDPCVHPMPGCTQ